ncbi:TIM-barrel domain-containing protein [Aggregatilinea lenta]|uniref:TIM-barrel domain-containing protein n=1 Tax=Aggregatilinea lenta TaxID=913108 RepID=UPI000E5B94A0|nr:TIM-barrel domain-containing protein [Aggregatilinea lenta]
MRLTLLSSRLVLLIALIAALGAPLRPVAAQDAPGIFRTAYEAAGWTLTVELLDDDLAHFELSQSLPGDDPIPVTPMIAKTDYAGPSSVTEPAPGVIETPELRLEIDADALCVTLTDLTRDPALPLTTVCPLPDAAEDELGLTLTQERTTDLYGLGEQFQRRGGADGTWMGKQRRFLNLYGNELTGLNGGSVGNAQFPILYALGPDTENYALFLDHARQQYWDFGADPFAAITSGASLRWYLMTGPDLLDLRRDYMELTGRAPVPPKQMFGLWVSEYGYEDWAELDGVIESLRAAGFPLDGFVLDLYWFGSAFPKESSQMGSLTWDEAAFPDPAETLAQYRDAGLGVMLIEEPYVSQSAEGYDEAAANGVLVRTCGEVTCAPVAIDDWWGMGGMVDFTDPNAAAWWHDHRRQPLIDAGVTGHWTDLGEPEVYDEGAWYAGVGAEGHTQADVHNLYNLLWSRSIWDGYARHAVEQRPFVLSRSGTSGSQRYGVAMWSGDIGANMPSLAAHMNVQMHMSLSGVDYFGADVGGFMRQALDRYPADDLYTIWLANAALLDVPLRPHVQNLQNENVTAPSLIGDVASNLANVRLRYELSPYLYTLAHRATRDGDPVFAPLVVYFQDDPAVRALGSQKMIGPDLMVATITAYDVATIPVYLPAGGWFDYYTGDYFASAGEWIDAPTTIDGLLRAPLFVRDGAILPLMPVEEGTLNMLGQRTDGSISHDLTVTVYAAEVAPAAFTLIEDDGTTMAYRDGAVRETPITATRLGAGWSGEIGSAAGTYAGAPDQRAITVHLITPDGEAAASGMLAADDSLPFDLIPAAEGAAQP